MEKDYIASGHDLKTRRTSKRIRNVVVLATAVLLALQFSVILPDLFETRQSANLPIDAAQIVSRCAQLNEKPGPPVDFKSRSESDRFVPGTKATLIKNARIWTGRDLGLETIKGDILLDKGVIRKVGHVKQKVLDRFPKGTLNIVDGHGAWVTPGIVDMHSHLGDDASPSLSGASDTNSVAGLTLPWMRSLDGLNTHDDSFPLSISGGVTTALVLPGSADAIGGQAFPIKLRSTAERSPTSMVIEPPYTLNGTQSTESRPPGWRYMKHACGENPSRVYHGTRMDTIWAFRQAYDKARQIKEAQDDFCHNALAGQWDALKAKEFPEELQWEALVDVLRGRVKVNVHCYEAVDLDDIVRLTNEFQFPVAAFHHAHEAYLVPDLLKKVYGGAPAVAVFATNARYKREAFRGSEFAPRILADHGIRPIMKSDHPVLNSRYLLYEAQQAHYYGLPEHIALGSVISTPAEVMGLDHRIGFIKEGHDADVVIWDSHPLALGATPKQVWIDGIPQFDTPHIVPKAPEFQTSPETPDFDKEARDAVKYDGLPPLTPSKTLEVVLFVDVGSLLVEENGVLSENIFAEVAEGKSRGVVAVRSGRVVCSGSVETCTSALDASEYEIVDLEGGSIAPGLVTFGSELGLSEIVAEPSTIDGYIYDILTDSVPNSLGGDETMIRAVDGLIYSTRDELLAYRSGVTSAVAVPMGNVFLGVSAAFSTGAKHKLETGAVVQDMAAVHVRIQPLGVPSVSTQVAALRRLLLQSEGKGEASAWFSRVTEGNAPLVIEVNSADIMATLLSLKQEVENSAGTVLQMVFSGAAEAHLIAKEIGDAGVGVIVAPSRPFPAIWSKRRILPGPPLTEKSNIRALISHNVTVGLGVTEGWEARNTRFDAAWAALEADGEISRSDTYALVSTNIERLLGIRLEDSSSGSSLRDLVATKHGDLLSFEGKVIGVISPSRALVDLF